MINTTTIKIANKYIDGLDEVFKDSDGYWAYTKKGFRFAETESHTAHGSTQKELLSDVRSLEACDCHECQEVPAAPVEEAAAAEVEKTAAPAPAAPAAITEEAAAMNLYKIKTTCENYGVWIHHVSAYTPFDAAEKAASKLNWRYREQVKEQQVRAQDGSGQVWTFDDVHKLDARIADQIEKRAL
jgi:hypothetical protein